MHLYYITDRTGFPGSEADRRRQVLEKIAEAARAGVDYVQLREKDLTAGELETVGREAVRVVRQANPGTKLLLNSRTDIAVAVGADGIHLRGDDVSPRDLAAVRSLAKQIGRPFLAAASCHSVDEVRRAELEGASFAVLGPIFDKQHSTTPALGLGPLEVSCQGQLPVFALGGVDLENVAACLRAGVAGIAAIRLFQKNRVEEIVGRLRSLEELRG